MERAGLSRIAPAAALLLVAVSAAGQSVNLIEDEVDAVRQGVFRLGPFYATPSLRLTTGYDSNALSTPVAESDVNAVLGPSARLALPLGDIAFFDVTEEVDFVYYREQIDLRRVFNVTRLGAGIGSRRVLFRVNDEFRDDTGRPTSEFDFPVQQRTNALDASLSFALGWRHRLRFGYAQQRFTITDGLDDPAVADRLNRVTDRGTLELARKLTAKTSFVAEGLYERFAFDDRLRDGDSYGARFGFDFSPGRTDPLIATPWGQSFLAGRFLLGFRRAQPVDPSFVDYTGLIASTDVTFGFGQGHQLHGIFNRDIVPSILEENWVYVENRVGGSFRFQMTERFSVTPGVTFGSNHYALPTLVESDDGTLVEAEVVDEHTTLRFAFDVRVGSSWFVGANVDYLKRDSNVFLFGKDRMQVGLILRFQP